MAERTRVYITVDIEGAEERARGARELQPPLGYDLRVWASLLEAAEVEGAGDFKIFYRIMLPLSVPILSTIAIINALLGWNNYIWPLVVTSGTKVRPIILALSNINGPVDQVQGIQFAGYAIASIPLLLLFVFATKSFISGITAGAVKG